MTLKERIFGVAGSEPSSPVGSDGEAASDKQSTAQDYLLRVTAGPSYDPRTHHTVRVNGEQALPFENEFMSTKIKVRIREYKGLPLGSPTTSPYFSDPAHEHDQYSIDFSFVPKVSIPAQDLVWGNDFDHSIRDRLPPGVNTAFKIVKNFVDPGLNMDAYADVPWLYGPALSSWFAFRIGDKPEGGLSSISHVSEDQPLTEGADGSGTAVRERYHLPDAGDKRRKHFLDEAHRAEFEFEKGRLYQGDFHNPYIDFGNCSLKLPGFSVCVIKHLNDTSHTLRYVFKNRKTNELYFCIFFTLLFGQDVGKAIAAHEQESRARHNQSSSLTGQTSSGQSEMAPQSSTPNGVLEHHPDLD